MSRKLSPDEPLPEPRVPLAPRGLPSAFPLLDWAPVRFLHSKTGAIRFPEDSSEKIETPLKNIIESKGALTSQLLHRVALHH
ncbi:hypothetical protein AMTR_s00065p00126610 [Amborella trichopoda]|uniref:Uncharacterized protein n=1 Tax=Amborella trichopoda TaxID=13333 RepID=U5CZ24_AMBTC|nr:hypothetical protein AMTR_s00065p00126610 [Amborella trichopoda]